MTAEPAAAGAVGPARTAIGERARRLETYRRLRAAPPGAVSSGAVPPGGVFAPAPPGTVSPAPAPLGAASLAAPGMTAAGPTVVPRRARLDAERLAGALDGRVERTAAGHVVRVRASLTLPLDVRRLARLPIPLDPAAPLCCLDTETTGLGTASGTLAFMVGLGCWEGERFVVEQLVLPDQPDEPALLDALRSALPRGAWLVTYNGRTFDWPLIEARYRLRRDSVPEVAGHLDLLPVARRLWRHRMPDARLATVETEVAGIRRPRDLPGALVPERYLAYLRTGQPGGLRAVAEHNRQDIVSLARLLVHLADRLADPNARARAHPGDTAALARAYARGGRLEEALACVDDALRAGGSSAARDLLAVQRARLLRRAGRADEASDAWHELATEGGEVAPLAWIELAKEREHRQRDPTGALAAVDRAARLIDRARLRGVAHPALERDLLRRRARLRQRLRRTAA